MLYADATVDNDGSNSGSRICHSVRLFFVFVTLPLRPNMVNFQWKTMPEDLIY